MWYVLELQCVLCCGFIRFLRVNWRYSWNDASLAPESHRTNVGNPLFGDGESKQSSGGTAQTCLNSRGASNRVELPLKKGRAAHTALDMLFQVCVPMAKAEAKNERTWSKSKTVVLYKTQKQTLNMPKGFHALLRWR